MDSPLRLNYSEISPGDHSLISRTLTDSLQYLLQQADKKARFEATPCKWQYEEAELSDPEKEEIKDSDSVNLRVGSPP